MKHVAVSPYSFAVLMISLLSMVLVGCENMGGTEPTDGSDSVFVAIDTLSETPVTRAIPEPDLLGMWKLNQMWVGNEKLPSTPGESLIEIKDDGTIVSQAPNLSAISSTYTYENGLLAAEAIGGEFQVLSLTASELILSYEVDGEQVRNVYERK